MVMLYVRAFIRLLFGFILGSFVAALVAVLAKVMGFHQHKVFKAYTGWKTFMHFILNIEVETEGKPATTPGILMANHRSYVDIALTPNNIPFTIVAKKSVKSWPLVGQGGWAINTIWVDRNDKNSRQATRSEMKKRLHNGESVLVFPEGTTTKGPDILPLKPGMFYACAEAGFPIHTFAIEYENPNIAWIDDDLFLPHFIREFGKKHLKVKVRYGPTFENTDGDQLRLDVENWLRAATAEMRDEWDEKPPQ